MLHIGGILRCPAGDTNLQVVLPTLEVAQKSVDARPRGVTRLINSIARSWEEGKRQGLVLQTKKRISPPRIWNLPKRLPRIYWYEIGHLRIQRLCNRGEEELDRPWHSPGGRAIMGDARDYKARDLAQVCMQALLRELSRRVVVW